MIKTDLTVRTSYSFYKKSVENPKDSKEYAKIVNGFMKFVMEQVTEGHEVVLPARLGTLEIRGRQPSYGKIGEKGLNILPPDWVKTRALRLRDPQATAEKRIVYCLNEETGGLIFKVHWSKKSVAVENKNLYSLRIARTPKRAISQAIKNGKEYITKRNNGYIANNN